MNQKQKQSMRKMRRILTGIIHQFRTTLVWVECFLAALVVSPREHWTDRTLSTVRMFHYDQMIRKSTSALAVIKLLIIWSDHANKGRRLLKKIEAIEVLSDLILNHFGSKFLFILVKVRSTILQESWQDIFNYIHLSVSVKFL